MSKLSNYVHTCNKFYHSSFWYDGKVSLSNYISGSFEGEGCGRWEIGPHTHLTFTISYCWGCSSSPGALVILLCELHGWMPWDGFWVVSALRLCTKKN